MDQVASATIDLEATAQREGPVHDELARAYSNINTLSELVMELDRRTQTVQSPERGDYASPVDGDPRAPEMLSPVARAVREQSDQVEQISNQLRSILSALQT